MGWTTERRKLRENVNTINGSISYVCNIRQKERSTFMVAEIHGFELRPLTAIIKGAEKGRVPLPLAKSPNSLVLLKVSFKFCCSVPLTLSSPSLIYLITLALKLLLLHPLSIEQSYLEGYGGIAEICIGIKLMGYKVEALRGSYFTMIITILVIRIDKYMIVR